MMGDGVRQGPSQAVYVTARTRATPSATAGRRSRAMAGFWLILSLVAASVSSIKGQEDYGYDYGAPPQPMRAAGGGGGGFFGPMAMATAGFFTMKFFVSGRRKGGMKKSHTEAKRSWEMKKREDMALINQQFNQMEASLTTSLDEKIMLAKQLEQKLYSLPDVNADGLITRYEFDKYMNDYKRTHPELTDHDLPRFEDMDRNNNGHINFDEWEEYQMLAMSQMQ